MVATSDKAIPKPNFYDTKRIRLTSPLLHIGSELQSLNPFEYVATSDRVFYPNSEALARALYKRGALPDYIARIEARESIISLLEDVFGDEWQREKDDRGNPLFPKHRICRKWTNNRITDLRPAIRNGMGQLYIPGSSIKGAIRTAIAYYLLKHEDTYRLPEEKRTSHIEQQLRERIGGGSLKKTAKFADDELFMDDIFANFKLSYQGKQAKTKNKPSPNTDFMRAVQVTDSQPIEFTVIKRRDKKIPYNIPAIAEVIVSSRFPNGKAKYRASLYVEIIHNIRTEFSISVDTDMLKWFQHRQGMKLPFQNTQDLLNICQEFAQEQWEAERFYWQNISSNPDAGDRNLDFSLIKERVYQQEACPYSLRLGWGSGLLGTTVGLCLDEELVEKIRDACGIAAPQFEAPKSRRTVVNSKGEIRYVPGWTNLKILE
jgi:CRISPR-associated protein Csm5